MVFFGPLGLSGGIKLFSIYGDSKVRFHPGALKCSVILHVHMAGPYSSRMKTKSIVNFAWILTYVEIGRQIRVLRNGKPLARAFFL